MGYLLLWLENLAVALLLVALLTACIAHLRGSVGLRAFLMLLTVGLPLLFYGVVTLFDWRLEFALKVHTGWFWPLALLLVAFLAGSVEIWRRGRRPLPDRTARAAVEWPRGNLALALAAAVLLHVMTFLNLDEGVKQGLTQLRAEATARALSVAPPRIPDHENAALIYQQAFDAMNSLSPTGAMSQWPEVWRDAEDALTPGGEKEFDYKSAELGEFLMQRAGELNVLRDAAAKPGCYFERDYGRPSVSMLLPEMQELQSAAKLLAVDARHAAATGNLKWALTDVNAMFAMARHAGSEPIVISTLVSAAIDQLAVATLQEVLRSATPSREDLATIDINGGASYRKLIRRAVFMDDAFMLNVFAGFDGSDPKLFCNVLGLPQEPDPFDRLVSVYRVFLLASDLAGYRRVMRENEEAMSMGSFVDARKRLAAIEGEIEEQRPGIIASLILPSVSAENEAGFRSDAWHAVAQTGLAMHRYRVEHEKFPDNLQQLSPEIIALLPRDPYDRAPCRLKKTDAGWIVYSVGPDLKDDGGRKFENSDNSGDLTMEYVESTAAAETPK